MTSRVPKSAGRIIFHNYFLYQPGRYGKCEQKKVYNDTWLPEANGVLRSYTKDPHSEVGEISARLAARFSATLNTLE